MAYEVREFTAEEVRELLEHPKTETIERDPSYRWGTYNHYALFCEGDYYRIMITCHVEEGLEIWGPKKGEKVEKTVEVIEREKWVRVESD